MTLDEWEARAERHEPWVRRAVWFVLLAGLLSFVVRGSDGPADPYRGAAGGAPNDPAPPGAGVPNRDVAPYPTGPYPGAAGGGAGACPGAPRCSSAGSGCGAHVHDPLLMTLPPHRSRICRGHAAPPSVSAGRKPRMTSRQPIG